MKWFCQSHIIVENENTVRTTKHKSVVVVVDLKHLSFYKQ